MIELISSMVVAGSSQAAGTILSLSDVAEGDAIHRGLAVPYYRPTVGYKALVIGDSITAQSEVILSATSVTNNGDGTARVVRTGHGVDVGQPIRIHGASLSALNVLDSYVTAWVDANTFDIALTGRRHTVTSASTPSVTFPLQRGFRGWLTWLEMLRGEMFDSTWCCVGGATSAQVTPLVEEAGDNNDVAFICIGMNDIYSAGAPLATIKARFVRLFQAAKDRARHVVALTVPPRNHNDSAWSAGKQTIHTQFNRWMMTYAPNSGGHCVDTWRATANGATYVDASASDPDPLAEMAFDNTHPSARGAQAIANAVKPVIDKLLPGGYWAPAHKEQVGANTQNLWTNSDFSTNTGNVATGWAVSDSTANMSITPSMVARTVANDGDAVGYKQRLSISYGTATGTASTRFRRNDFHASVPAGKWVQLRVPFAVASAAGLVGLDLTLFGTTTSSFWQVYGPVQNSNSDPVTGDFAGVLMTPIVKVPALTDLDCWVRPYISSAQSSAMTLDLWQPELRIFD